MKIILLVSSMEDADVIATEVERGGHQIVATIMDPSSLNYVTAQFTPHALISECRHHDALSQELEAYRSIYPDILICACNLDGEDWQPALVENLDRPRNKAKPRPYAQGPRVVYHAAPLLKFSSSEKLKRPKHAVGWQKECEQQEARFVMMLQAGRENHAAALHYFRCLQAQAPGLNREIGYRLAHGSYKGYWARDLASRWLGLLAHYVLGVETDYLPAPMTPGPAVDYIAHEMGEEGLYALTLVLLRGVSPAVAAEIQFLGAARFTQQPDSELFAECLRLYGLARLLAQVGTSLVRLMTIWLDPMRAQIAEGLRSDKRNLGILRDFYGMQFILCAPHPLCDTLAGFHAGTTYVPHPPRAPSFRQWRQIFTDRKDG